MRYRKCLASFMFVTSVMHSLVAFSLRSWRLGSGIEVSTPQCLADATDATCHASGHCCCCVDHTTHQGLFKGRLSHARIVKVAETRSHTGRRFGATVPMCSTARRKTGGRKGCLLSRRESIGVWWSVTPAEACSRCRSYVGGRRKGASGR